jgi:hypothetical protein
MTLGFEVHAQRFQHADARLNSTICLASDAVHIHLRGVCSNLIGEITGMLQNFLEKIIDTVAVGQ